MSLRLETGEPATLGTVLAKAGEGTIHDVAGRPGWAAKVFHPTLADLAGKLGKVTAMVQSPPPGVTQPNGFVVLTWPLHTLSDERGPVGYVMPKIGTANAVEIHALSNPSHRSDPPPSAPQWTKRATWGHLVNVATNLCLAAEVVHRVDAVIGDFQERNILVADTTEVTLVDCDSMQFTDRAGRQFLCRVGRPEFTAPELAEVDLGIQAREKSSDLFALAVHIHLLLMAGNHPFLRGEWSGGGSSLPRRRWRDRDSGRVGRRRPCGHIRWHLQSASCRSKFSRCSSGPSPMGHAIPVRGQQRSNGAGHCPGSGFAPASGELIKYPLVLEVPVVHDRRRTRDAQAAPSWWSYDRSAKSRSAQRNRTSAGCQPISGRWG